MIASRRCSLDRSRRKDVAVAVASEDQARRRARGAGGAGWFADRDARARGLIGAEARLRVFAAGEAIYRVGDPPDGLYGLVEGTVRISFPRDDGEDLVLHRVQPGTWLGDLAYFAGGERLVSVSAVTRTCTVHLSAEARERLVAAHPHLWRDFYALSHLNYRMTLRVLASMLAPDSERRVALRLLQMDEQAGEPERGVPIPQAELAAIVGVSVPTLQRVLRRLGKAGLIDVSYGRVRVRDRTGLLRRLLEDLPAAEAPPPLSNIQVKCHQSMASRPRDRCIPSRTLRHAEKRRARCREEHIMAGLSTRALRTGLAVLGVVICADIAPRKSASPIFL